MKQTPNILLILTDQQATHTLSCYQSKVARSPNLDAFAADGIRFDRAYTPCALCTPARASLLTGLLPHNHGALYNTGAWSRMTESQIGAGLHTFPAFLKGIGYQTTYIGKWHAGIARRAADIGLEGFSLEDYGIIRNDPDFLSYLESIGQPNPQRHIEFVAEGGPPEQSGGNTSGWISGNIESSPCHYITNRACAQIDTNCRKEAPWFCAVNFWEPHAPYLPTEDFKDMYQPENFTPWESFEDPLDDCPALHRILRKSIFPGAANAPWSTWARVLTRYYAQAAMVDYQVGRLIAFLKEKELYNETLVIFASDHGESIGIHGGTFDKGGMAYEEIYRIPLIVKLPGNAYAGEHRQALVSLLDLAPTFCDFAGTSFAESDGLSLRGVIENGDQTGRDYLLSEDHGHRVPFAQRILWNDRFKYVWNLSDTDELYDLCEDPHECENRVRHADHAHVLENMRHEMLRQVTNNGDRLGPQVTQMLTQP